MPPTAAAPAPDRLPRPLPASVEGYLQGAAFGGKFVLPDMVRSSVRDGRMTVEVKLPDALSQLVEKDAPSTHPVRIAVEGSDLTWSVKSYGEAGDKRTVALACYDIEALAPFQCLALHVGPGMVKVYGAAFDRPGIQARLELTQNADGISFSWAVPGEPEQSGHAATLAELRQKHPRFAQTTLAPAMRRLGLRGFVRRHPAGEVYRAFPAVKPDPRATAALAALLPRLGAAKASEREAASADLERLGRPGVLAVLHLDRAALTPEQNARLEMFLRDSGEVPPRPRRRGGRRQGRQARRARGPPRARRGVPDRLPGRRGPRRAVGGQGGARRGGGQAGGVRPGARRRRPFTSRRPGVRANRAGAGGGAGDPGGGVRRNRTGARISGPAGEVASSDHVRSSESMRANSSGLQFAAPCHLGATGVCEAASGGHRERRGMRVKYATPSRVRCRRNESPSHGDDTVGLSFATPMSLTIAISSPSPSAVLWGVVAATLLAYAAERSRRRRSRGALRKLAVEWRMNYGPADTLRLTSKVARHFPVPGEANLRVVDVIYGADPSDPDRYRYVFTAEYTEGVVEAKHRLVRVGTFSEPRDREHGGPPRQVALAPAGLSLIEQYRHLAPGRPTARVAPSGEKSPVVG